MPEIIRWGYSEYVEWVENNRPAVKVHVMNLDNLLMFWEFVQNLEICPEKKNLEMLLFPEIINMELRTLYISYNKIHTIPSVISNLQNLETFNVSNNQLTTIPVELGNIATLDCFRAENNQLATIPAELGNINYFYIIQGRQKRNVSVYSD